MKRATALVSVFLFFAVMAVGGHADNDDIDDAIQNTILQFFVHGCRRCAAACRLPVLA